MVNSFLSNYVLYLSLFYSIRINIDHWNIIFDISFLTHSNTPIVFKHLNPSYINITASYITKNNLFKPYLFDCVSDGETCFTNCCCSWLVRRPINVSKLMTSCNKTTPLVQEQPNFKIWTEVLKKTLWIYFQFHKRQWWVATLQNFTLTVRKFGSAYSKYVNFVRRLYISIIFIVKHAHIYIACTLRNNSKM